MTSSGFSAHQRSFRLLMISLLVQAISLALYGFTGVTEFTPVLSVRVLGFGGASLILGVAALMAGKCSKENSVLQRLLNLWLYIVYALSLLAWLFYMTIQVNYITNILVAIDGTSISPVFILTVVSFLAACVLALAAAVSDGKSAQKDAAVNEKDGAEHA